MVRTLISKLRVKNVYIAHVVADIYLYSKITALAIAIFFHPPRF